MTRTLSHFRNAAARQRFARAYAEAMAALPVPSETHDIATDFGSARVYAFGTARAGSLPLVLLPGRGASTPMWQPELATLAKQRKVYCIDLIGEPGKSEQTQAITRASDHARWIDQVLAALALERVHLCGVSIGGWTACNQAIHAPARIRSLLLLEPVNVFAPLTWQVVVVSLGAALPLVPRVLRQALLRWISGGARASDADPIAKLIASGLRDFVNRLPPPTRPSASQLRALGVPVLVLLGGRSIVHSARRAERSAKQLLTHGSVERWDDASHAIHGEAPRTRVPAPDRLHGPGRPELAIREWHWMAQPPRLLRTVARLLRCAPCWVLGCANMCQT